MTTNRPRTRRTHRLALLLVPALAVCTVGGCSKEKTVTEIKAEWQADDGLRDRLRDRLVGEMATILGHSPLKLSWAEIKISSSMGDDRKVMTVSVEVPSADPAGADGRRIDEAMSRAATAAGWSPGAGPSHAIQLSKGDLSLHGGCSAVGCTFNLDSPRQTQLRSAYAGREAATAVLPGLAPYLPSGFPDDQLNGTAPASPTT